MFLRSLFEKLLPNYFTMQGSATLNNASMPYVANIYNVVDRDSKPAIVKAVRVKTGSAGGNLNVHLVGNPAGVYELYELVAQDKEAFLFDQIEETATTIPLTDIKFYV